ncbi:MAG TPA: hypothetical protein VM434_13725, partial [Beijerinckiaceae bacterium]|nr:hypothetical protein [Beijerinckiaceae bacterium]
DQDTVSRSAQVILQAKKYGIGLLLITQRTANVSKSVLNQCNTVFSFRAFDETGFEFLKNYMGTRRAAMLPNLLAREAVVAGKAITSSQPLIVRFSDQAREVCREIRYLPNTEVQGEPIRVPVESSSLVSNSESAEQSDATA